MISLDIKTTWERYDDLLELTAADAVKQSLAACKRAKADGRLETCPAVVTLFRGREGDLPAIAEDTRGLDLVLQQGGGPPGLRTPPDPAGTRGGRGAARPQGPHTDPGRRRGRLRPGALTRSGDVKHNIDGNARL